MGAQREKRCSSYSFTISALDGVNGQRHAPAALYPRGKCSNRCRYEIQEQKEVPAWYTGIYRPISRTETPEANVFCMYWNESFCLFDSSYTSYPSHGQRFGVGKLSFVFICKWGNRFVVPVAWDAKSSWVSECGGEGCLSLRRSRYS
jgi:hypothetical protein